MLGSWDAARSDHLRGRGNEPIPPSEPTASAPSTTGPPISRRIMSTPTAVRRRRLTRFAFISVGVTVPDRSRRLFSFHDLGPIDPSPAAYLRVVPTDPRHDATPGTLVEGARHAARASLTGCRVPRRRDKPSHKTKQRQSARWRVALGNGNQSLCGR